MAISCKDVSQSAVGIYIEVLQQTRPFEKGYNQDRKNAFYF